MFIRVKTRPNTDKKSVQLVESVRNGKKVNQKVIRTIGYAYDDEQLERLKDLGEHIKATMRVEKNLPLFTTKEIAEVAIANRKIKEALRKKKKMMVDIEDLREKNRVVTGIHDAYGEVYQLLGFDNLLTKRHSAAKKILYNITMARLAKPASKRASVAMLAQDYDVQIDLHKAYRMLDKINEKVIKNINKIASDTTSTLLKGKIKVMFYDCTTLYFESFTEDELKQNGYSKDRKFNQPQVLLALLVSEEGLPLGYDVFPGSSFEGHTLVPVLEKIKEKYDLKKNVFVADSGLLSKKNREYLDSQGCGYVLGARLKSLPKQIQKAILNNQNYKKNNPDTNGHIAEIPYKKARLIISYNEKRAAKDKHDRNEVIDKLKKRLSQDKNPKSLLSSYGYKKYLHVVGKSHLEIDQRKIQLDEQWDGLHGVITNVKDISASTILSHYCSLWQIENCFRIQKHNLKIRPIFHWTPARIKAHIAICFIAFVCHQYLAYRLRLAETPLSIEQIRNALLHVQISVLEDKKRNICYGLPSKIDKNAAIIYKLLGLKIPTIPFEMKSNKLKM